MLVDRAIGELSLVAASEGGPDGLATATEEALRLRDLLKFDFFFARRRDFAAEMAAGAGGHRPGRRRRSCTSSRPADARRWLEAGNPLVSPLVLRPFLDAYHLVADRLAAWEDEPVDEPSFLDECLRVGRQWAMQGRLASEESVSLELFKPALRLAAPPRPARPDRTATCTSVERTSATRSARPCAESAWWPRSRRAETPMAPNVPRERRG